VKNKTREKGLKSKSQVEPGRMEIKEIEKSSRGQRGISRRTKNRKGDGKKGVGNRSYLPYGGESQRKVRHGQAGLTPEDRHE